MRWKSSTGARRSAISRVDSIRPALEGSDPEDGDLIYFVPWGNLGFYYNTEGVGYSDEVIRLGTYEASLDELAQLEGDGVNVEIVLASSDTGQG